MSSLTRKRNLLVVTLVALLTAPLQAADPPKLPIPEGWRTEDTEYPPPWAKQLPWKGKLQLRFPPGFFKADDDYFWSYPIMYWLEGDVLKTEADLTKALRAYDAGLYGGRFAKDKIRIDVQRTETTKRSGQSVTTRVVAFHGFDPFVTRHPLTTHLEVDRWFCPNAGHTIVLILRSPREIKDDDPVRQQLRRFRAAAACPE